MQSAFGGRDSLHHRIHQHTVFSWDGRSPHQLPQNIRSHTRRCRTLLSALFRSRALGASGVTGIIFWPHQTRRGPPQQHFRVARFQSGGVRRRRFALHHLWKKIPRRRAHLRGAKARTAKIYAVVIFSEEKDGIPVLLKYFGSLTTRWRIDPPADFVRQKHPPR